MSLTLTAIYEMNDDRSGQFGLTEEQTEALTLATERGFFVVPREIDLQDLSTELGISHQLLSERLRRAQYTLNINTVLVRSEPEESAELSKQVSLFCDGWIEKRYFSPLIICANPTVSRTSSIRTVSSSPGSPPGTIRT
ncbi:helix-turn-helix domain-containing protein [Natronorarus salvus]|uniref:helix-turn-helix domain-containing protein n=1 Tax=Natronorarus salvus TaxID=3117733 RepID=UPI00390822E4